MMHRPTATYRLQFRDGMDFDRAADLVPYLAALGVSHLYASPIFTASQGSTHGYDVIDPGEVDPALGGREGLERLSRVLRDHGLGLILDIVPNHMAFSPETPWLRDILRHGGDSRFARHFDIDQTARLRLPWLPVPFAELAEKGALAVEDDPDGPVLAAEGLRIPLARTASLERARQDPAAIPALHDEQPWQATHWRTEMDAITHRRFFNITGLIGLRVEDRAVFDDVHALLFDLIDAGIVDGVRIDHIDGLADPDAYLRDLRTRLPDTPIWVEKILTGDEAMPDWPIEGTTGYEVARQLTRVLTDPQGLDRITARYRKVTGRALPFAQVLRQAKRQILARDLSAELWALHALFRDALDERGAGAELGPEALREALIAFIEAFPTYRTYTTADRVPEADARLVADTVARADPGLFAGAAIRALGDCLTADGAAAGRLRVRLQQVTGAVAAKAQEDTAFYREVRLLSMNEVGGEPNDRTLSPADFHAAMTARADTMPAGLTLTSSHDTKRSEDARARLIAATYDPDAFDRWHAACAEAAPADLPANLVWYLAQSRLALGGEAPELGARLADHIVKALREAKETSFHTDPDEALEAKAQDYARKLAEAPLPAIAGIEAAAAHVTLAQVALKLTVPGIPDVYQGTETLALALTDPDNRRPVDFDALSRAVEDPSALPAGLARDKFLLTRALLQLRRDHSVLFLDGGYEPLEAPGMIAYRRAHLGQSLEVAIARDPGTDSGGVIGDGDRIWPPRGHGGPLTIRWRGGAG